MDLIAHRGFASEAPENTLAAVRRAADRADAVEVDVRRCGTGELVVVHDPTVDRVTDGSGAVADLSLSELRGLDVLQSGERVPLLADVLDAVPGDTTVNLELKEPGLAADALAVADAVDSDVLVSAFSPEVVREVADVDSAAPTALVCTHEADHPAWTADRLGCDALHPSYPLCLTTWVVRRAHENDLAVNAWTVSRRPIARLLEICGVDGVIADSSDVR
jgi:glycerophosphoryl diester phosphodiesterase